MCHLSLGVQYDAIFNTTLVGTSIESANLLIHRINQYFSHLIFIP